MRGPLTLSGAMASFFLKVMGELVVVVVLEGGGGGGVVGGGVVAPGGSTARTAYAENDIVVPFTEVTTPDGTV